MPSRKRRRELIPGGLAPQGRCPRGVAGQLRMGIKVELEHTKRGKRTTSLMKARAREIACDHLWEDRKYYSKLLKAKL